MTQQNITIEHINIIMKLNRGLKKNIKQSMKAKYNGYSLIVIDNIRRNNLG